MISLAEIDPSVLRELLRYEPETGHLYWRPRDVSWFKDERSSRIWNTKYAEKRAFTCVGSHGYLVGTVLTTHLLAHRVILAMLNDTWPDCCDHINGVRIDNRLVNIRDASFTENSKNLGLRHNNTSGRIGVCKVKDRWRAQIEFGGKNLFLGEYRVKEDAIVARLQAEEKYGYHQNHGSVR